MRARWPLALLLALPLVLGCSQAATEAGADTSTGDATAAATDEGGVDLSNPRMPALNEQAPDTFKARFETSQGDFVVKVDRSWSPHGADRFYNLVKSGYFDGVRFFRAVDNFMVQFGIHGDPKIAMRWLEATIPDDPVKQSNKRGLITYAMSGQPNSRSVQVFINYKDNAFLDAQGFAPFGEVIEGMEVVDSFYKGYGERTTSAQGQIASLGNTFLDINFPKLDEIETARLVD